MATSMWIALVAIFIVYYLSTRTRSYVKLRQFPGPWLASFSELWLFRQTSSGEMHLGIAEVIRKYGMLTLASFVVLSTGS